MFSVFSVFSVDRKINLSTENTENTEENGNVAVIDLSYQFPCHSVMSLRTFQAIFHKKKPTAERQSAKEEKSMN